LKEPQITPALAARESGSGSDLSFVAGKYWIATMSSHGSEEADLCQRQRISVNMLSHVWHASSMEDLVEQTLSSLNFPEVHTIGMSQQFESQRNNPRKILYVQGSTICSLFFCILAPVWDTAASFIELNLRVCPNALLSQIQAEYHPLIFSEFFSHPHRAPRPAVYSAAACRCHASLDPRLAGILFPEGL